MINLLNNKGELISIDKLCSDKKHPLLRGDEFNSYSLDFGHIKVMFPEAVRVVIHTKFTRLDIAL